MTATPPPPNPRHLLKAAGLAPKKSWGQNFLCDQHVLAEIAAATECGPDRPVLELGAGLGALTYHLLLRGGPVHAVERDREIVPLLTAALDWADDLHILEADAGHFDFGALAEELGQPLVVAGNLPYQVSSRILVNLAEAYPHVEAAVLLVQREVAQRLCADPGSKTYGLLSVLVGRVFDASIVRHVAPGAFLPPPKVTSSVVSLRLKSSPWVAPYMATTAKAAFAARRKTLRNSLAGSLGIPGAAAEDAIVAAGLDPKVRAETLQLAAFDQLGAVLADRGLV